MEGLIAVANRLQEEVFTLIDGWSVDLPQLAVVGSQSVGKSTVIEALVGRQFLPRGSGIVTRRPLVLQLKNSKNSVEPWAEFSHCPGRKVTDFAVVKKEIENETIRVAGKGTNVSSEPIFLKIHSSDVVDLTLVDLPGITKVPVGEQPANIEAQLRALIFRFISRPNCLVLAVSAATADLATSDALNLAREVDPKGSRTIGVLTKMDLVDDLTQSVNWMSGAVYPLRLGYFGLASADPKSAILENKFFSSNSIFLSLSSRCGARSLASGLSTILTNHIRESLPDVRQSLTNALQHFQAELAVLGDPVTKTSASAVLLQCIVKYCQLFQEAVDGQATPREFNARETPFTGARLRSIFVQNFGSTILEFSPTDGFDNEMISSVIKNCAGTRTPIFVPECAFDRLVRIQIAKLSPTALKCADLCHSELVRTADACGRVMSELDRFRVLRERITKVAHEILAKCLGPTRQMIKNLVQSELAYINTNHPDFIGGSHAIALAKGYASRSPPPELLVSTGLLSRWANGAAANGAANGAATENMGAGDGDNGDVKIITILLKSYIKIVQKNLIDLVPKCVMYFMVNTTKDALHRELVSQLYKEELFGDLLEEGSNVTQKRSLCREKIRSVKAALAVLDELRE